MRKLTDTEVYNLFLENVEIGGPDECWLWTGSLNDSGYGSLHAFGTSGAHRIAWILLKGELPDNSMVLHSCDERLCCNPAHLFLGDQVANMQDMARKGRAPNAKLSKSQVQEIRRRRDRGETLESLAARFGVVFSTIDKAVRGKTWAWVS